MTNKYFNTQEAAAQQIILKMYPQRMKHKYLLASFSSSETKNNYHCLFLLTMLEKEAYKHFIILSVFIAYHFSIFLSQRASCHFQVQDVSG